MDSSSLATPDMTRRNFRPSVFIPIQHPPFVQKIRWRAQLENFSR